MTETTSDAKVSRTQAERTAAMRGRLLDAAVESLVELGYARTSTQEIARRAGVSRGTQLQSFSDQGIAGPLRPSSIWSTSGWKKSSPLKWIVVEASRSCRTRSPGRCSMPPSNCGVAARTDPVLHAATVPLERKVSEALEFGSAELFGDRFDSESVELTIELVRGLAVSALFRTSEADGRAQSATVAGLAIPSGEEVKLPEHVETLIVGAGFCRYGLGRQNASRQPRCRRRVDRAWS